MERSTHHSLHRKRTVAHLKFIIPIMVILFLLIYSFKSVDAEQLSIKNADIRCNDNPICSEYDLSSLPLKHTSAPYPDYYFAPQYLNPGDEGHFNDSKPPIAEITKTALNEFKFLSGVNRVVLEAQKTIDTYSRRFKLTGEFDFNRQHKFSGDLIEKKSVFDQVTLSREPVEESSKEHSRAILRQFAFHKVTWVTGFDLSELSFKLGLCDALMLNAWAGNDIRVGATLRVIF